MSETDTEALGVLLCPCREWQIEFPRDDPAAYAELERSLRAHALECRVLRGKPVRVGLRKRARRFLRCSR